MAPTGTVHVLCGASVSLGLVRRLTLFLMNEIYRYVDMSIYKDLGIDIDIDVCSRLEFTY